MIVCTCRNISTRNYPNLRELQRRLAASDQKCGRCLHQKVSVPIDTNTQSTNKQ